MIIFVVFDDAWKQNYFEPIYTWLVYWPLVRVAARFVD